MSLKLKALGLSLVAAMAVSAVAVMSASANVEGHFSTPGASHTTIEGHVGTSGHTLHLKLHGLSGEVGCHKQVYHTTTTSETSPDLTIFPEYAECFTTPDVPVGVDTHGCWFTFRVAKNTTDTTEQTAHLLCPAGKAITVTHPNCTVTIHPQTTTTGITYTTKTNAQNIHDITMDVNVEFDVTKHGLCQFVGPTTGKGTLVGWATVTAEDATTGDPVPLTAT